MQTIRTVKDLTNLKVGDSFIVDPGGLPDDPEELIVSDAWKQAEQIRTAAAEKFTTPASDSNDNPTKRDNRRTNPTKSDNRRTINR